MFRKATVALAASALVGLMATPATATTDSDGAYHQRTGGLKCVGFTQNEDPNLAGQLSARVRGAETRNENAEFKTFTVVTRLVAQKRIDGNWRNVKRSAPMGGQLGAAEDQGSVNVAPFEWAGFPRAQSPRMRLNVESDGIYRLRVVTDLYNVDNVHLTRLATTEGNCRIA